MAAGEVDEEDDEILVVVQDDRESEQMVFKF
jgi:hypothetical protein